MWHGKRVKVAGQFGEWGEDPLSPSTMSVSRIELELSGLAASTLTQVSHLICQPLDSNCEAGKGAKECMKPGGG